MYPVDRVPHPSPDPEMPYQTFPVPVKGRHPVTHRVRETPKAR